MPISPDGSSADQRLFQFDGHDIAYWQYGSGADLVLLHGFPSSSADWTKAGNQLAKHYRVLHFDFLGYGKSAKPIDALYSIYHQSALATDIIRARCNGPAIVVGHDLGGIVLQVLLSGKFGVAEDLLSYCIFMNSSVYADLYQPSLSQRLLTLPFVGPAIATSMNERTFRRGIQRVSGMEINVEITRMWEDFSSNGGKSLAPKHLVYMKERAKASKDLESAMEAFGQDRLAFLYGDADPVSGQQQLDRIRSRLPATRTTALRGLGHFPMLENSHYVAAEIHKSIVAGTQSG